MQQYRSNTRNPTKFNSSCHRFRSIENPLKEPSVIGKKKSQEKKLRNVSLSGLATQKFSGKNAFKIHSKKGKPKKRTRNTLKGVDGKYVYLGDSYDNSEEEMARIRAVNVDLSSNVQKKANFTPAVQKHFRNTVGTHSVASSGKIENKNRRNKESKLSSIKSLDL
jgi:hypothetical protein